MYILCNCLCLNYTKCTDDTLFKWHKGVEKQCAATLPEDFIYFVFKLQVKDQGKSEAGELYCKLEKVCYFNVVGFASWVFFILYYAQKLRLSLVTQWQAEIHILPLFSLPYHPFPPLHPLPPFCFHGVNHFFIPYNAVLWHLVLNCLCSDARQRQPFMFYLNWELGDWYMKVLFMSKEQQMKNKNNSE